MHLRIAVPHDRLYTPLIEGTARSIQLLRVPEEECSRLLRANRVELALLSPLAYGQCIEHADYRIVPTSAIALEGYTERVWLYFRPGVRTLSRCIVPSLTAFLTQALRIVLQEAYELDPVLIPASGMSVREALHEADAVLSWEEDSPEMERLDVAEEWFHAFGHALPVGFWVCRPEELPAELPRLVEQLSRPGLAPTETVTEQRSPLPSYPTYPGVIHWHWDSTVAEALKATLELLYYHGLVPHLAEVKLWDGTQPSQQGHYS